jgi:hypothetical protein
MGNDFYRTEPLWGAMDTWKTANRNLEYLIRRHGPNMNRAVVLARDIQVRLESSFLLLDDLCAVTCPWCPDHCCLAATVWIDFKDLLFLHLNGHQIPPAQLLGDLKETCLGSQRLYVASDCQTLGLHMVFVSHPEGEFSPKAQICSGQVHPGGSGHKGRQERNGS